MISGDLPAQRRELHHSISVQLHKSAKFSGEHERRRVSKVYKSEIAVGMHFTIKHSRKLARIFFLTYTQCVTSRDRLRQTQVHVFKQLRRCRSVMIKLGEHESMKRIVYSRGNFRRNKSVSLCVHQQDSCNTIEFVEGFGDPHLLPASCISVFGFHFGPIIRPGPQPLHMIVYGITRPCAWWERIEIFLR